MKISSQSLAVARGVAQHLHQNINGKMEDVLIKAKTYSDGKLGEAKTELNTSIGNAKTEAVTQAKTYSDGKLGEAKTELNTSIGNAKTEAVTQAKTYSDGKLGEAKTELNTSIGNAKMEAVTQAKTYSDGKLGEAKTELNTSIGNAKTEAVTQANTYSDGKLGEAKTELNTAIDTSQKHSIKTANDYTDSKFIGTKEEMNRSLINNKKEIMEVVNNTAGGVNNKYEESIAYANTVSVQAEVNANNYTDKQIKQTNEVNNIRFKQMGEKVAQAEKRLNAGIAGVTAIASIPYVAENSFSYGVGIGTYQNGNAIAGGVSYKTSRNTNVRVNISWDSSHNSAIGVGFAGGW